MPDLKLMNICIDIGNTFTKVAVFEGDDPVFSAVLSDFPFAEIEQIIKEWNVSNGIVSSVKSSSAEFYAKLQLLLAKLLVLESDTNVPVVNQYKTPETLGKDRLAAVVGASYLYPKKNLLVIDAGSAITFDFINEHNQYMGGNISPGLSMRFKALHEFTSKLPLLSSRENFEMLGTDTSGAIISGVQNSIIFETDTYIHELNKVYPGLITVITGGDSKFFDNKLKIPYL